MSQRESPNQVLVRLYGDKQFYSKYEAVDAIIEYAYNRLNEQHQRTLEILRGTLNTEEEEPCK